MKESAIDFEDYDYIMFTDASGDDGFQFKERSGDGSSFTFVSSCFVTKPEDIDHNKNVLNAMKKELNIPIANELKSTTLKRHRFSKNAYEYITNLKGVAYSCVTFKHQIQRDPVLSKYDKKSISATTQTLPYFSIHHSNTFCNTDKILIVMDNMKKIEMDKVQDSLLFYSNMEEVSEKYTLIFRDSKTEKYNLIQIADVIAGALRTYFEQELSIDTLKRYCKICPNQRKCIEIPSLRKERNKKHIEKHFADIFRLHVNEHTKRIILGQIVPIPPEMFDYYKYIDCKLNNKKRS